MIGFANKRLRVHRLVGIALFVASISHTVRADPVTIGACISLANSAMSLFGSKTNLQAAQLDNVLSHVRVINQRLDNIEGGIVTILEQIEQLPARWRADMRDMIDELTIQNAMANASVIDDILSGLRDARTHRSPRQQQEMLRRLRLAVNPFKVSADWLMMRSGAAAPAVISVMVRDVWLERHLRTLDVTTTKRLERYDEYFADMQDEQVPESIANVNATLERLRTAERRKLLHALSGNESSPSVGGTYGFYSATLMTTRTRTVTRTREHTRCFGRGENRDCVDSVRSYTETIPEQVAVKTVHRRWALNETPRTNYPGLSVITVEEQVSEEGGGSSTSTTDIAATDRSFDDRRTSIRKSVEMLNRLDDALVLLHDTETAVALARTLIASWNNDTAEVLAQRTSLLAARGIDRYRRAFEDHEAELIVQATRAGIADARRIARELVASAERVYSGAVEQARRSAWQREVAQVLAAAQLGLQAYQTVNMVLAKFAPPAIVPRPDDSPAPNVARPAANPTEARSAAKRFRVTLERNAAARSFALAAAQLIEAAQKEPASRWVNGLPADRPVRSEALLQQALAYLDMADKAAAATAQLGSPAGSSDATNVRDTVTAIRQGKLFDALVSSVSPSRTSNQDMLGGLHHRNLLRQNALDELARFIQIRTEQARRLPAPAR